MIKYSQYHTSTVDVPNNTIISREFHATKAKLRTGLVRDLRHILSEVHLFAPSVSLALLSDLQSTHGFFLVHLPGAGSLQAKGVQLISDLCPSRCLVFSEDVEQVPYTTNDICRIMYEQMSAERFQHMLMDKLMEGCVDGRIEETGKQTNRHIHTDKKG